MYLEHFGFNRQPFSLSPDPEFFYGSVQHKLAMTMLEYSIANGCDICLLSGEVGCGKTMVVESIQRRLSTSINWGLIRHTHDAYGSLTDWVTEALGLDALGMNGAAVYRQLIQHVSRKHSLNQRVVLVVDEAQNLSDDNIDAIRILTNINTSGAHYLQVVLVGQPEIRERLAQPRFRPIVQRIAVDYDIKPLEHGDVENYVQHRLKVSGGRPELFTPQALQRVATVSRGIPRVINMLCDFSLLFAYADQGRCVGVSTVDEVVEQKSDGLFWLDDQQYTFQQRSGLAS